MQCDYNIIYPVPPFALTQTRTELSITVIYYLSHAVMHDVVLFYTVSQKNDNNVLRYNFNAHQPILIIFGRDIAE